MRIVVVGAGVGGMVTALRLAKAGHAVTVLEQGQNIGGKLNRWDPEVPGIGTFRFDTGPHVLTMPWAIRELFDDLGERMEDHLCLERVDPICRYHFPDAPFFDAPADPRIAVERIAERFPGDEKGFQTLLDYAKRVNDVTVEPFLRQDFGTAVRGIPNTEQWRQLLQFIGLQPWRTIHDLSEKHLTHPKLRQIFDLYAFYNGSSPYKASAIFAIIAWVQWGEGTFYLRGGLRTYADALATLARRSGVMVRCNCRVRNIDFEDSRGKRRVKGVVTADGEKVTADAVVCNADPIPVCQEWLPGQYCPPALRSTNPELQPSTSAFVLLLGVRGSPENDFSLFSHYNSFLPESLEPELEAIFQRGVPADDPVIGVTCQSVSDADAAPPGYTNLFIMTSPPALGPNFAWTPDNTAAYRNRILSLLETRRNLPGLRERIVCEQVWTPETFKERYGSWRGSLYGVSSNGLKSAFFRPPNRARGIKGLYFVGGGTHPGGGLPLVTLGGKIVAEAVQEDCG